MFHLAGVVLLSTGLCAAGYDYVVVGGGVAGSVVATRLAEKHSVLLLNIAGAPPSKYNSAVMVSDELIVQTNLTATPGMAAHINQPGYAPMPKFSTGETGSSPARWLGGSSLVGLSLFLYDKAMDWAPGWDWNIMMNYMLKSEIQPTHDPVYLHPLTKAFIKAVPGAVPTPVSQRPDGTKITAQAAYLEKAPEKLTIMEGVRADRLIIKGDICTGVEVRDLKSGSYKTISAGKEVIVSAGYIYTPRLLFLSGLGDAKELAASGIPVVKDLPAVGKNLVAPRYTPISWHTSEPTLAQMMGAPISKGPAVKEAFQSVIAEATVQLSRDAIAQFMPLYYDPKSAPLQYSLQGEPWPLLTNAYTVLVSMRTEAKGMITFDKDPDVSPTIDHEPLTANDMERGAAAVEAAVGMGSALPSQGRVEHAQDWSAVYDGRGTCRMGTNPSASVVDTSLRVHGVRNLRIVDGSAIPASTPFLAMPEVLMLAERAADLIGGPPTYSVADIPDGSSLWDVVQYANILPSDVAARSVPSSEIRMPTTTVMLLCAAVGLISGAVVWLLKSRRAAEMSDRYVMA